MIHKHELEYYARRHGLALVLVLGLLVFLLPLVLRIAAGSPVTPGTESYLSLRKADLLQAGMFGWDPLHQARIAPDPYSGLVMVFQFFGVPWLLPVLLALLLCVLLYHYTQTFMTSRALAVLLLGVLVLSPSMSVHATHHTGVLLCLVFIAAALLLFPERPILGGVALLLSILTIPQLGLFAAIAIALVAFLRRHWWSAAAALAAMLAGSGWFYAWTGQVDVLRPVVRLTGDVFFELGATTGMSVFIVVLAAYGIFVHLGKNHDFVAGTILLFAAAFVLPAAIPLAVLALALFAARGIYELLTTVWELALLQQSLLVLLGCVALFLLITTVRERTSEDPTADFAHTMVILRNQHREGAVLTAPSYAPVVEHSTGRKATLGPDASPEEVAAAFSRSPEQVYPLFARTNTTYVLITEDMRRTMFRRDDDGILFLLRNTERFVPVDATDEHTLWYFIAPRAAASS